MALKEIRLEHEEGAPCTAIREGEFDDGDGYDDQLNTDPLHLLPIYSSSPFVLTYPLVASVTLFFALKGLKWPLLNFTCNLFLSSLPFTGQKTPALTS